MTSPPVFRINDECVDRTKYDRKKLKFQRMKIRKFTDDGAKAIVHYVHCPAGSVVAVDVRLLNRVDGDGFLVPSSCFLRPKKANAEAKVFLCKLQPKKADAEAKVFLSLDTGV